MADASSAQSDAQIECDVCGRVGVRGFKALIGEAGDFIVCANRRACTRRKNTEQLRNDPRDDD